MTKREKLLAFFEVMRGLEEYAGVRVSDWGADQVEVQIGDSRQWLDDEAAADAILAELEG